MEAKVTQGRDLDIDISLPHSTDPMEKTMFEERNGTNFFIKTSPRHRKSFKSLSETANVTVHRTVRSTEPVLDIESVSNSAPHSFANASEPTDGMYLRRMKRSWTSDDPSYLRNRVALSITEMKKKYSRDVSTGKGKDTMKSSRLTCQQINTIN